jgi:hypothetical protein
VRTLRRLATAIASAVEPGASVNALLSLYTWAEIAVVAVVGFFLQALVALVTRKCRWRSRAVAPA